MMHDVMPGEVLKASIVNSDQTAREIDKIASEIAIREPHLSITSRILKALRQYDDNTKNRR